MGAGIFHENVMKASNVSGKSGIAGGMGIERMACIKFGINDVRDLYKNDFRLINQLKEDNN
jgi:phenylalanyl-tRNA synthetase alpha chain